MFRFRIRIRIRIKGPYLYTGLVVSYFMWSGVLDLQLDLV